MANRSVLVGFASYLWSSVNHLARTSVRDEDRVRLGIPIVSIGNLQAGGSGKTPMTIETLLILNDLGARPAVLTRGYRSLVEKIGGFLAKERRSHAASAFGDESRLIFEKTGCPVFVGRDRPDVYRRFVGELPEAERPTILVLDDGFQQFKLKKDLEIVCITSRAPDEEFYRDFFDELTPNDFVVRTKVDTASELRALPNGRAFDGEVEMRPKLPAAGTTRYVLVTAFANAERFEKQCLDAGLPIDRWYSFSDHHPYKKGELEQIEDECDGQLILTSEKDWVKIRELSTNPRKYHVVPLELEWNSGRDELRARLKKLIDSSDRT